MPIGLEERVKRIKRFGKTRKLKPREEFAGGFLKVFATDSSAILQPHRLPVITTDGDRMLISDFEPEEFESRIKFEHDVLEKHCGVPVAKLPKRLPKHIEERYFDGEPSYIREAYRDLRREDFVDNNGALKKENIDQLAEILKKVGKKGLLLDSTFWNFGVDKKGNVVIRDIMSVLRRPAEKNTIEDLFEEDMESLREPPPGMKKYYMSLNLTTFFRRIPANAIGLKRNELNDVIKYLSDKHGFMTAALKL